MNKNFHFLPNNKEFSKFFLFHWLAFTTSSIIFAVIAVLAVQNNLSSITAFLIAFFIACFIVIVSYTWYFRELLYTFQWFRSRALSRQRVGSLILPQSFILAEREITEKFLAELLAEYELWQQFEMTTWLGAGFQQTAKATSDTYRLLIDEIVGKLGAGSTKFIYIKRSLFEQFSKSSNNAQKQLLLACIEGTVEDPQYIESLLNATGITAIADLSQASHLDVYREINRIRQHKGRSGRIPDLPVIYNWMQRARQLPPFTNPARHARLVNLQKHGKLTLKGPDVR